MVVRRDERITRMALGSANHGGRLKSGDEAPQLVEAIAVDRIDPDPNQPRRHFNPDKLRELADSLLANGQIQPIAVVRSADRYTLLVGERRWRASQLAGLPTIRAVVRATPLDAQRALIAQIVENEQRDALAVSELIEAVRTLGALGLKNVEIARALSKNPTRVSELQALADGPAPLAAIVDTLGLGLSYQLLRQWRAHPNAALEFIAHVPVEHISRVTIATIGQGVGEGDHLPAGGFNVEPAAHAPVPPLAPVEPRQTLEAGAPLRAEARAGRQGAPSTPRASYVDAPPLTVGSLEVEHPDHGKGLLVFGHSTDPDHLAVSFDGGPPIVAHKDVLRIVRAVPPSSLSV